MLFSVSRRYLSPLLVALLSLASCQHPLTAEERARMQPRIVPWEELTPRERAENTLYNDLFSAQRIERDKRPGQGPEDSVDFSLDGREYRFANVHAYRANIKHRWDSLRAAGSALDIDTSYHAPTPANTVVTPPQNHPADDEHH